MWNQFKTYLLIDKKLKDSEKNLSTIKSKFIQLEGYFGDKEFTRDNFNMYIMSLKEKGLAAPTINNTIKVAKHYDKFLKLNIIQDYTYFRERSPEKEALTEEEVVRLALVQYPYTRLAVDRNFRDKVVINFLFDTACRIGELQSLLWVDVKSTPIPNVSFRDTKTGDDRTIPISKDLYELLMSLPHNGNHVFDSATGKMYDSTVFNGMLKERARLAKVDKLVHAHIFRHSRITHLANVLRYPPAYIMEYVGHKSFDTTKHYIHTQLQELSSIAYASPFGNSSIPLATRGEMIKEFVERLINKKNEYVQIEYPSSGETVIRVLNIPS